jgi:hypothetical protein
MRYASRRNLFGKDGFSPRYGFFLRSSVICVVRRYTWLMFESRHNSLALSRNFEVHVGHVMSRTSGVALFCCPTMCMNPLPWPRAQVDKYGNICHRTCHGAFLLTGSLWRRQSQRSFNTLTSFNFLFLLTTCFGHYGPSSGEIYN